MGKNGGTCDFTKGKCSMFEHLDGKDVTYGSNGAVSAVGAVGDSPTLRSRGYIFFGKVEIEMQAAPGAGIVTSMTLVSDDLDEIDLEFLGADATRIQSNTFSKGDNSHHDLLGYLPAADGTSTFHKYGVDWTTDRIEFSVDGKLQRTLRRADISDRYPETPMRLRVSAWAAGYDGADQGTIHWAGGEADFSHGPAKSYFKSISMVDYAGGSSAVDKDVKEYSYGDHSGKATSIQIKMADGSTTTGGKPSPESSSSSSALSTPSETGTASKSSSSASKSKTPESKTPESKTSESTTSESTTGVSSTETTMSTATASATKSGAANKTASSTTPASKTPSAAAVPGAVVGGVAVAVALFAVAF